MTELAVREDTTTQLNVIHQTASDLSDSLRIGKAIADTSFAPAHFRGKAEECAIAILYGQTIGLDPMTAVQQVFVIGGKPALYARAMVAIALAAGHEIWTEAETDGAVTVAGRRRGTDRVERITWNLDMARRAGYTSNKKYQTDPRSMLYARASGDIARRIAPDALLGMAYTVEEMQLEPDVDGTPVITSAAFTPAPAADVQDADIIEDTQPATPDEMITAAQLRKMGAQLKEMGLTGRAEALGYVKETLGREVTSRNDLTKAEATTLIDALDDDLGRDAASIDVEFIPPVVDTENGPVDTATGELDPDDQEWLNGTDS